MLGLKTLKTSNNELPGRRSRLTVATDVIMSDNPQGKYPLLENVDVYERSADQRRVTIAEVAQIFGVQKRAIYDWISNQKLSARDLPGRGRFLSEDLEEFLRKSKRLPKERKGNRGNSEPSALYHADPKPEN